MSKQKILVVDDEAGIRSMFRQSFNRAGYAVQTAASAEEALDHLEHENMDVMFFDLDLPGMDGIELCRLIRKDRPMAIIYAVTGYASLFELADCREAGFDDYFIKPTDIKNLITCAKEAFAKIDRWKQK